MKRNSKLRYIAKLLQRELVMGDVIEFREDDRERRKLVVAIGDLTHLISKTTDPMTKASLQSHRDRYAERLEKLTRPDPQN